MSKTRRIIAAGIPAAALALFVAAMTLTGPSVTAGASSGTTGVEQAAHLVPVALQQPDPYQTPGPTPTATPSPTDDDGRGHGGYGTPTPSMSPSLAPSETPSASPSTAPTGRGVSPGELPTTGPSGGVYLFGGLLLSAIGVGLLILGRRRRAI